MPVTDGGWGDDGQPSGLGWQPPSDAVVNLLHRTGLPTQVIAAEVHQWVDGEAMMQRLKTFRKTMPPMLDGLAGPDALWDAVGERIGDYGGHRVSRLHARMPDLYRIDYLSGDWGKKYSSIACDGKNVTKLFSDRVATGPAKPLDADFAAILDPAWLLSGWRVLTVSSVTLSGRAGFRLLSEVTETAASFRIEPTPRPRIVTDSGGPLGDRNLPRAAEAAGTAASLAVGGAIVGAVAVTGWLEKHRGRRHEH